MAAAQIVEDSLEEGEVTDSEGEEIPLHKEKGNAGTQPGLNPIMEKGQLWMGASVASLNSGLAPPILPAFTSSAPRQPTMDLYRRSRAPVYGSDSSSSGEESDENFSSPIKRPRSMRPGLEFDFSARRLGAPDEVSSAGGASLALPAPAVQQKKARNNVWGAVMVEQTLTETVGSVKMWKRDDIMNENRGVEDYDFTRKFQDEREIVDFSQGDAEAKPEATEKATDGDTVDLAEKESFGMEKKKVLKTVNVKDRLGRRSNHDHDSDETDDEEEEGEGEGESAGPRQSVTTRLGSTADMDTMDEQRQGVHNRLGEQKAPIVGESMEEGRDDGASRHRYGSDHQAQAGFKRKHKDKRKNSQSMSDRLGERSYDQLRERQHIRVTAEDEPSMIAQEMVVTLNEPDEKILLFTNLVNVTGAKKALQLLYMTEDLEEAGGMLTLDGTRRRTPGGVFFQLLRSDKHITRDQMSEIFKEDRKKEKEHRKMRARRRHPPRPPQPLQDLPLKKDVLMRNSSNTGTAACTMDTADDSKRTTRGGTEDGHGDSADDDLLDEEEEGIIDIQFDVP